ncbi:putative protein kinase [Leptomonas pyrrhocoris]|uniref:non-specific serine/threonine protein kinase n=1 Tax=Leptomonas pyrrhocoris TaxID=157538 RepID=A0A0M9FYR4_LEPPY|nr:putative protein kinase [Leptomonas pyrrhocoris]XP_015657320.1 putative protein kinase [Leptomonas pyrrhocoris]KPA78880.1 putative protein kinase [Leptomonas pyrrhocoris]KPA78881.1 putative protein kinase [Leptomonas pyrrhocoris]|eukprot:XP_015657319.1 putative protein kinase [Leptomonas pyrrhocoris]
MRKGDTNAEESSSPAANSDRGNSSAQLQACDSAANNSDFTSPLAVSKTAQYAPCNVVPAGAISKSSASQPSEEPVVSEKAVQQSLIIVEEEPALVHTHHHVQQGGDAADAYTGPAYTSWSPASPDLAELIPIGTTPSQRESVATRDTETSPYSPSESHNGSPRAVAISPPRRISTAPGELTLNATATRNPLTPLRSACRNSSGTEPVQDTPAGSIVRRCTTRYGEAESDPVKSLSNPYDTGSVTLLHTSAPSSPLSFDFHRCATAAPTRLRPPSPTPARSSYPAETPTNTIPDVSEASAPVPAKSFGSSSSLHLRVLVHHDDTDSAVPLATPLSFNSASATKTNAIGGAVPHVPAIRLPAGLAASDMESDRSASVSVLGYGPRSAPNACSLVSARSARSARSSRSGRHSHRYGTSTRTALPGLRELFPTLPAEMYLARERLCVAHDSSGNLGTGAYGMVKRAELYPPEVEVPRFFTPVTEVCTSQSNSYMPGYSPANSLPPSHNFASIAGTVDGADGAAETPLTGAHSKEHFGVFLHSRLASAVSMDSASALPLHQQPYNDQTASFYNGLDDVPALPCVESLNDSRWLTRGQSPEVESVVVSGPLAVHTDSEETSAAATQSAKSQQGMQHSPSTGPLSVGLQDRPPAAPPASVTSCYTSQKFPDLPVVLATKVQEGDAGGASLTSTQVSVAKLARDELDVGVDDHTVRTSAGDDEAEGMLAGPLNDSPESEGLEFSPTSTSTAGTLRFTSLSTPRWTNKTYCHSSRTAGSNVPDAKEGGMKEDEGEEEVHSDRWVDNNSITFPTQTPMEREGTAAVLVVVGDEGKSVNRVTSKLTTEVQVAEMRSNDSKADATALTQAEASTDVAKNDGADVHGEAALRLPLVLSREPCTNTSSTSCNTADRSPTTSGGRVGVTTAAAGNEQKTFDAICVNREGTTEKTPTTRKENVHDANCNVGGIGSSCLPDGREGFLVASATVSESQGTPAQVGDDNRASTTQQAEMQAVSVARGDSADTSGHLSSGRRCRSQGAGTVRTQTGSKGEERIEVGGDKNEVESGAAAVTATEQAIQPSSLRSNTPALTTAATLGHLPTGDGANTTSNGDGKGVEQVSPTSTVSYVFSGGATSLATTRTSRQDSVTTALQTGTNLLRFPSNTPQTPLVRYGVNTMMISEAISNGSAPFRPVATKVVEKSDLADNPMKLNAFHNELRMASRLNHPCLVNMFGVTEDAETFYLVMDLAEKGNLSQYQKVFGVQDTRAMAPRFLADVVLALEYLRDGSQHTYWMTSTASDAAVLHHATSEENGGNSGAARADHYASDSCPGSTSSLPLQPTADGASCTTTKKPPTPSSAPGISLKRRTKGEEDEGNSDTVDSTSGKEGASGEDVVACACCPTKDEDESVLMKESIVLHRDVKPDNLLLTWDFHVKLADFGDACFYGDEEANSFGGTPSYISPEVIQTSKAGPYSDLWAMGCILYELLVGEKLFTGSLREVAKSIQTFSPEGLMFPTAPASSTSPSNAVEDADCDCDDDEAAAAHATTEDDASSARSGGSSGDIISAAAQDLVLQLLRHIPEERLGSVERGGFAALKRHPFFAEIDWSRVLETTNITTTNTDYTSELADYLEPGEGVVYCSPVKVLATDCGETHTQAPSTQLAAPGSLVMVLTDTPRLFLVNPDTETVQFWLPWTRELRVAVLRADRFSITVPIYDALASPSTPGVSPHTAASIGAESRNSTGTASAITYTFYDTTRRADLWGVKIHDVQSACLLRRRGGTPTFPSRQPSSTQLHCPPSSTTRRGTPTLSPRAGGCLLHRLRTTPRCAHTGGISSDSMFFSEAAITMPRDGRNAMAHNADSYVETFYGHSGPSTATTSPATAGVPAASQRRSVTRYSQPIRLPATSFLVSRALASVPTVLPNGKATATLTSPAGVSSGESSTELRSPEVFPAPQPEANALVVAPMHRRVNMMTVTVASSSNPQPGRRARPSSPGNTGTDNALGVSPVGFGATAMEGWARATGGLSTSPAANDVSFESSRLCSSGTVTNWSMLTKWTGSINGSDAGGGSLGEDALGFSSSVGDVTPRATRVSDGEDGRRPLTRDMSTQSESTPGPLSVQRNVDVELEESGCCSCPSRGRSRGARTPAAAASLTSAPVTAPPKEKMSKVRLQYKKRQQRKSQA